MGQIGKHFRSSAAWEASALVLNRVYFPFVGPRSGEALLKPASRGARSQHRQGGGEHAMHHRHRA